MSKVSFIEPVQRPEIQREIIAASAIGVIERPLSPMARLLRHGAFRKGTLLIALALIWEVYGRYLDNPLLFPSFSETAGAFIDGLRSGELPQRTFSSVKTLLMGYAIGIVLASLLTIFAISTRIGADVMETLTSMFNPLPAIALLPLSLIWFGLGPGSIIFVLTHSVLWAVALNTHSGFRATSTTLRMVGRNYGLRGWRYIQKILIPAAFPSILTGLKIGWAFAWRTLIAAEMVFGVSSGSGGLGWFIFQSKNQLDIPSVFAGLLSVILIGLFVENFIFRTVEERTVRRWAMQS
jgi:NitT/TauT family transport system permease protein